MQPIFVDLSIIALEVLNRYGSDNHAETIQIKDQAGHIRMNEYIGKKKKLLNLNLKLLQSKLTGKLSRLIFRLNVLIIIKKNFLNRLMVINRLLKQCLKDLLTKSKKCYSFLIKVLHCVMVLIS